MPVKRSVVLLHNINFITACLIVAGSTGCNLCCPGYLDDYATVGGKWSRANPTDGRVGSVFSDPGILHDGHSMDSEHIPQTALPIQSAEDGLYFGLSPMDGEIITLDDQ